MSSPHDFAPTVNVATGEVLTVTAAVGSYGTVWSVPGAHQWSVGAKSPLRLPPGTYRIETVKGSVSHTVSSAAVAALEATLPGATATIASAAVIAKAIQDGKAAMSLHDKFARLADRAKTVPAAFAERGDKALARLDAVEARGGAALDKLDAVVADAEQAAAVTEDAVNQLTNVG